MRKVLGVANVHKKMTMKKGKKYFYYRVIIPHSVLERLGLSHAEYVLFKKKSHDVQLVRVTDASATETYHCMGIQKIGTRGRICLPKKAVAFFKIADDDIYLKFVELEKNDIRLRKIGV